MMDEINPRVVVGFDALPRLRTSYLVAARRRGLPTVFCQHGLFSALDYPSPWFDEFLVVNEYTRELLSGQIPPTARITVVGDPSLDALVTQPPQALRAVPEHSGQWPSSLPSPTTAGQRDGRAGGSRPGAGPR